MKTKMTNRTKALLMTKKGEINQQIKRMISNCHFGNDCKIYPKYYRFACLCQAGIARTLILTASCPPACINTLLAAVIFYGNKCKRISQG